MNSRRRSSVVLLFELAGFVAIIALSWLDELIGVPALLFGGAPHHPEFRESAMESVVVILVAIPILLLSRRLLSRLFYLEKFLKVCAWCKRVDAGGRWLPMERYFEAGFDQKTTHGMCPDCYAKMAGGHG